MGAEEPWLSPVKSGQNQKCKVGSDLCMSETVPQKKKKKRYDENVSDSD